MNQCVRVKFMNEPDEQFNVERDYPDLTESSMSSL